jgi:hypothetical protein
MVYGIGYMTAERALSEPYRKLLLSVGTANASGAVIYPIPLYL